MTLTRNRLPVRCVDLRSSFPLGVIVLLPSMTIFVIGVFIASFASKTTVTTGPGIDRANQMVSLRIWDPRI